ncbi:hypothetical protein V8C34DRAFT_43592 [Trichoderma compactum]
MTLPAPILPLLVSALPLLPCLCLCCYLNIAIAKFELVVAPRPCSCPPFLPWRFCERPRSIYRPPPPPSPAPSPR